MHPASRMRICLLSLTYPPMSTDGIPRQRHLLATSLARLGHDVHVVFCGTTNQIRLDQGVTLHEMALEPLQSYEISADALNHLLTHSQRLFEGLLQITSKAPCDIVDVPLWMAQGFVTLHRYPGPTVVWLQTTYAQLLHINQQKRSELNQTVIRLERACLERAQGVLGDSIAAIDAMMPDYAWQPNQQSSVVPIGIAPVAEQNPLSQQSPIEALVVGRLERRKGTPWLFSLLPTLLKRLPHLTIRFVGRDNSASDGWYDRYHMEYGEYFLHRYPQLSTRVFFDGYVDEATLQQRYCSAAMLLVPSLYESFGIVYLEAMRVKLPIVTFATGGATEIFRDGHHHGAMLVPLADRNAFLRAVTQLTTDPDLRQELGQAGYQHFIAHYTDDRMARATLHYYQQVIQAYQSKQQSTPIYQVVEALYEYDAVSESIWQQARLLQALGYHTPILARSSPARHSAQVATPDISLNHADCHLIMHYSGYTVTTWMLRAIRGRKAICYHNITPPHYFAPGSLHNQHTQLGYAQLRQIAEQFDCVIGDSSYNLQEFARAIHTPKPGLTLYPIIEPQQLQQCAYDQQQYALLRSQPGTKFLFVGRMVPNKRPNQLMRLLNYYCQHYDAQATLWLVGDQNVEYDYQSNLHVLQRSLPTATQIVMTGSVSTEQLYAYYRAADIFVCASEHEGFCVPIAEAMAFGLPVVAYASSAIPETMGGAGVLLEEWDVAQAAAQIAAIQADPILRQQIIEQQYAVLGRFSQQEAQQRLAAVVQFLQTGEISPLFHSIEPFKAQP
jgi:glycosyltransferase involved in cell wall biosynthesis